MDLSSALLLLGKSLVDQRKHAEAEPLLAECLAIRRQVLPAGAWQIATATSILVECLAGLGRHAEAEPLLVDGYETMEPPPHQAFRKRQALDRVVAFYEARGKPEKAAAFRAKAGE
jgi:hypothetical protein